MKQKLVTAEKFQKRVCHNNHFDPFKLNFSNANSLKVSSQVLVELTCLFDTHDRLRNQSSTQNRFSGAGL